MQAWKHIGTITEVPEALEMFVARGVLPETWCDPRHVKKPASMRTLAMLAADPQGCVTAVQHALDAHRYIVNAAAIPQVAWVYSSFQLQDPLVAFGIQGDATTRGVFVNEEALPFRQHFPASVLGTYTRPQSEHEADPSFRYLALNLPMRLDYWNDDARLFSDAMSAQRTQWNTTWNRVCKQPVRRFPTNHAARAYIAQYTAALLAPQTPFWRHLLSIWQLGYAVRELSPERIVLITPLIPE